MQVLSGRYGPYVKHGDVNATLPRGKEPAALTMDEAVLLIAERAAKGPSKPKGATRQAGPKPRATQGQGRRGQASRGQSRRASPRARPSRPAPERPRSRQDHRDGGPQTERTPAATRACRARKRSSTSCRMPRAKAGQARDRARLLGQGRRPRRAEEACCRDGRRGPAERQPQGLQGARASCRPWRCSRSWPATPTAN